MYAFQGQAKVFALLPSAKDEDEVFVVLEGSTLLHVLPTKIHTMLCFIVPGVSYLTYVEDEAQEFAEYLVTHGNCLSPTECTELIGRYDLRDSIRRTQMDRRVTLALDNLHTPHNLLGQSAQESLLHLSVRLGFTRLSEFLLCHPGGLMAITTPNEEGDTPLQLAQKTNQHTLIQLLTNHTSGMLSLSTSVSDRVSVAHSQKSAILLLRECVRDSALLSKEYFNSESADEDLDSSSTSSTNSGGFPHEIQSDSAASTPTDSSDTIITSINIMQSGEEQALLDMEIPNSESPVTSSPRDTPLCSAQDDLTLPSLEETTTETESQMNSNIEKTTEEDRDKFVSPSKTETEKYKVIRTLSFLRSRMASSKTKSKISPHGYIVIVIVIVIHMIISAVTHSGSSSHSSPSLSLSGDNNYMAHRRRSNSEGCGHDIAVRKSWFLARQSLQTGQTAQEPSDATDTSDLFAPPAPLDYTAESWSVAVEKEFCRNLDRQMIKRQEIIYELMQTEFHHVQTLTVMAEVLRRGLMEVVQLEQDVVGQIFPCLDDLIAFHQNFLVTMETRQRASTDPGNRRNFLIRRIGDILVERFSGVYGAQMTEIYGDFCSRHPEALRVYKQQLQSNRKLQLFLRQQSSKSVIRRREIPEFLLLVTQRITKYPVLLERLLPYTEEGSMEQRELRAALAGLREVIAGVERRVGEYQRARRLQDIVNRLDNKSCTRLKSGEIFSKQDLQNTHRRLTHSAAVTCRTTSGRLRDVLALLLTDVLAFLQEKEQKFTFAALEQKPSVVPLRRLIVREVANQGTGLFLISSESSVGPEMYEIHTHTKEERSIWITLLRQAAEKSTYVTICSVLEEKLRICTGTSGRGLAFSHLLVHPRSESLPQGVALVTDAQKEGDLTKPRWNSPCFLEPVLVPSLSPAQYAYAEAAVVIQDSCYEVQKLLLQEDENSPAYPVSNHSDGKRLAEQQELSKGAGVQSLERQQRLDQREREQAQQTEKLKREREEQDAELQALREEMWM
ncbi:rho guanine nucleotide exchange factor 28 [Chanos chanos]|uniref:Rho guanine nucleotide exchange factor 28 n=1 Tax=Chanos chanos TaxID=29144 RepID=A0A6J2VPA4_CHACN|nr:rho guanine nucleotide exchange factor 28-like [Chanos chanos]